MDSGRKKPSPNIHPGTSNRNGGGHEHEGQGQNEGQCQNEGPNIPRNSICGMDNPAFRLL